jgi:Ser/Thr protein kinase RdoA (MazF antagonist)
MARLHRYIASWNPPKGFTRRRWNWEGLFGDGAGFNLAGSEVWNLLPQTYYEPFKRIADQVRQVMDDLGEGVDAFGLIHADLQLGEESNVLFYRGDARPIDFDDCGYGYWVYDFASTLCHWKDFGGWHRIKDALMSRYAEIKPLPHDQLEYLDLFMAARHVSEILWAVDLAQTNPDFKEQVDDWMRYAGRHVKRYLSGS